MFRICANLTLGLVVVSCAGGCATRLFGNAQDVTLENAMKSVAVGLREMHDVTYADGPGGTKAPGPTGLLPTEAEVTFNLSAQASDNAKVTLSNKVTTEVSRSTTGQVSGSGTVDKVSGNGTVAVNNSDKSAGEKGFGAEAGTTMSATRGNVVTVKFKNILVDPELRNWMASDNNLKKLIEAIRQSGLNLPAAPMAPVVPVSPK